MNSALYANYLNILKQELVPALGCTEPIAIAYAAAKAHQVLGEFPDSVNMSQRCHCSKLRRSERNRCSGNPRHRWWKC